MIQRLLIFIFSFLLLFSVESTANSYVDSLKNELKNIQDDTIRIEILNELAWELAENQPIKGIQYAQEALQLSDKSDYKVGVATAYNRLALNYEMDGRIDSAINFYERSFQKRLEIQDTLGAGNILLNIGAAYFTQGFYNLALKYYLDCATLLKSSNIENNKKTLAKIYNNIGLIHRTKKEFKEAIKWYEESLTIKNEIGDERGMLNSYINLSMSFQNVKDYTIALKYTDSALNIALKNEWEREYSDIYTNQASIFLNIKKFKESKSSLDKAQQWLKKYPDKQTQVYTLFTEAEWNYEQKHYEKAIQILLNSIEIAQAHKRREILQEAYALLAKCYNKTANYKAAYQANIEHQLIRDSIFNVEGKRSLDEQQIIFNVKESEEKITLLNYENQQKEQEKKQAEQRFLLSAIFLIASVIGSSILVVLWRKNKSKNMMLHQKNAIIEQSLQDKEILLREIHHRVKNNLQIITGLLELQESLHENKAIGNLVSEAQGRIKSMALIHEMLYQHEDISNIDFSVYVQRLVNNISKEYIGSAQNLKTNVEIKGVYFNIDTIIPLGLILNELLTNAFKYAFLDVETAKLFITIDQTGEKKWQLTVKDNGPGIQDFEHKVKQGSFGLKLVKMLSRQLRGNYMYKFDGGAVFLITFEEQKV